MGVILHVGMHKTGTTSLQRYLATLAVADIEGLQRALERA